MILLYIYLGISILCLILYALATIDIGQKFRKKYPDLKGPASSWAGILMAIIRIIVISFIPLMNFGMCWLIVFNYDQLVDSTMKKVYLKFTKEY